MHGVTVHLIFVDIDRDLIADAALLEVTESIIKKFWYPFWHGVATEVDLVAHTKGIPAIAHSVSTDADRDDVVPKIISYYRSPAYARPVMADHMLQRVDARCYRPGLLDGDFLVVLLGLGNVGQFAESSAERILRTGHVELIFYFETSLQLEEQHKLNPCGTFMLFSDTIATIA